MKNNYTLLLLLAAIICLGIQCKKDDDSYAKELAKLPPYTKKGYNTFGCLINGKAFPQNSEGYHQTQWYYYNGDLFINYSTQFNTFDVNQSITIRTNKIHAEGTFLIDPVLGEDQFTVITGGEDRFYSSILFQNPLERRAAITITRLDSINHIISGTFAFKARAIQSDKEVSVEQGRFDLFYQ
ncbi:MAG: hypothetical protein KBB37_00365 [Bacteroidia bacterium]|nr:hypothetical protein [Bacteroidia bacterium]MBP7259711.1 hypothetical protein [Bacteroidia bacterium]MBP9179408.1 hypothetical protein [Bacteroidia bacterium]MBP9723338.1 hypothetical protein [Bacteroidia bacterium]